MDYIIIGDSCLDTNDAMDEELGISKVPFSISVGEKHYKDDGNMDIPEFLKTMNSSLDPVRTAAPTPGDFLEAMGDAKEVYIITISSRLSASYNNALLAVDLARNEKHIQCAVIDSKSAMSGETLLALKIQEFKEQGMSFEETAKRAQEFADKELKTFFILETFENLIKNGRISKLKGTLASFLHISPIMYGDDGEIKLLEMIRGSKKSFKRLVDVIGEYGSNFEDKLLTISHCNNEKRAESIVEMIKKQYNFKKITMVSTTGLGSVYANQGGIVISF